MVIQLLVNGIATGCAYALIALGFSLIYNTARAFHFAHGAVYTLSAYMFYTFHSSLRISSPVGLVLALVLTALFGILIDELIYTPLVRRGSSLLVQLLSSLGLYIVTINCIALGYGNEARDISHGLQPAYSLGAFIITRMQALIVLTFILIFSFTFVALKWSPLGRMIRATRDDPTLVMAMGLNTQIVRRVVFAVGSVYAALAAILTGLEVGIDPQIGMAAFLNAAVAVIIGGVGNYKGAVLGALMLGILQSLVVWQVSARWQEAITFLVLIFFLLFRPEGVLGVRRRVEEVVA